VSPLTTFDMFCFFTEGFQSGPDEA